MINMKYSVREFIRFALPSTASMLVFSLYTIIDGIFVAKGVGEHALGAVNIAMPFMNAIFAVAVMLGVGTSTVAAVHIGSGDMVSARKTATQNILVVAAAALAITTCVQVFTEPIALFLGATDDTLGYVVEYLKTVSIFTICVMVSYCLEVLVKTDGHPALSTVGVLSACVVNIVLDYVFVMKLGMGVYGAALATGIAQFVSMCIFIIHFLSKRANIRPLLSKPFLSVYKRIIPLGTGSFVSEISLGLVTLLFNRMILEFIGPEGIVSFAVISYVNTFVLMISAGVTQGMQPLVSMYHGAGENAHSRGYYKMAIRTLAVWGVVAFVICQIFAGDIAALMIEPASPNYAYTIHALRVFSSAFILMGVNECTAGYFAAMERPVQSTVLTTGRGLVFVSAALVILTALFGGEALWLSPLVSDCICFVFTVTFILRDRKKRALSAQA